MTIESDKHHVKQVQRCMHPDLAAKVETEVDKVVNAGFIREVQFPIWLANVVSIIACAKDDILVPHIELPIDATTGYKAVSYIIIKMHLKMKN